MSVEPATLASVGVTFVVAASRNRVIGCDGDLPWRLPRDLKHFRRLTWGKPIVMGRKTHASIGRALPGRLNIVLSRGSFLPHDPAVQVARSVEDATAQTLAAGATEMMVVGGGQVYEAFLPLCRRIHLTRIEADVRGDTFFPFDPVADPRWRIVHQEDWEADEENPLNATYLILTSEAPSTDSTVAMNS